MRSLARGAASETFEVQRGEHIFVCKRLTSRAISDEEARRAFRDEQRVLALLDGRGAPRLAAHGDDDGGPYLVMIRVAGSTLDGGSREDTPAVARAAFAALAQVHEASDEEGALEVAHGDLSPSNVAVDDTTGAAWILDFGLARWRDASPRPHGSFRGTLAYAAPELARGEPPSARADLFALAAACLHAASGIAPRPGAGPAALVAAAEESMDAYLASIASAVPHALLRALAPCLAFATEGRPARARDVFGGDPW